MKQRVNEFNQPVGELLPDWEPRSFPGELTSVGLYTIVTRLSMAHCESLYDAYSRTDHRNWTYLFDDPPTTYDAFKENIQEKIANKEYIFYSVIDKETNKALGTFSLMRIDQSNGVIEVGNVNFSDDLKRTRISTEAHHLLAAYVFEELEYRRYEWKCDSLNAPSMKTAKRLGFTYEGTFRHAVIYKNRSRDTSWFSMLQEEWPFHKEAATKWLASENFDDEGVQVKRLGEFK